MIESFPWIVACLCVRVWMGLGVVLIRVLIHSQSLLHMREKQHLPCCLCVGFIPPLNVELFQPTYGLSRHRRSVGCYFVLGANELRRVVPPDDRALLLYWRRLFFSIHSS